MMNKGNMFALHTLQLKFAPAARLHIVPALFVYYMLCVYARKRPTHATDCAWVLHLSAPAAAGAEVGSRIFYRIFWRPGNDGVCKYHFLVIQRKLLAGSKKAKSDAGALAARVAP
jgi:hypothetical protein